MTTENKLHPLLIVAATSVTVASLAAVASFTGLLPLKSAPPAELTASAPAIPAPVITPPIAASIVAPLATPSAEPVIESKPAALPAPKVHKPAEPIRHAQVTPPKVNYPRPNEGMAPTYGNPSFAGLPPPPPMANAGPVTPPICRECGTIEMIREIKAAGEGSGLGAVAGGLLGGLLGHQVGRGSGRDVATVVGAAGGAFAGHQVEKNTHGESHVEITVRFDDDSIRTINQQEASRWRQGDRIRLRNGNLLPI
jgi:hypothetical protein